MGHEAVGRVEEVARTSSSPRRGRWWRSTRSSAAGPATPAAADAENLCARRSVHGCVPERPGVVRRVEDVPALNAVALHDGAPAEWGALVEPLSVGAHGVRLAGVRRRRPGARRRRRDHRRRRGADGRPARRRGHSSSSRRPSGARSASALGLAAAASRRACSAPMPASTWRSTASRGPRRSPARSAPSRRGGTVMLVGIWQDEIPFSVSDVVGARPGSSARTATPTATSPTSPTGSSRGERDLSPIIQERVGFDEMIERLRALRRRLAERDAHASCSRHGVERT